MFRSVSTGMFLVVVVLMGNLQDLRGQEKSYLFVDDVRFKGFPAAQEKRMGTWGSGLSAELCAALRESDVFIPMTLENMEAQLGKEKLKQTLACTDTACVNRVVENFGISESIFGVVRWIDQDSVQVTLAWMAGGEKVLDISPRYVELRFKAIARALAEMALELTTGAEKAPPGGRVEERGPDAPPVAGPPSPRRYSSALESVRQADAAQSHLDVAWAEVQAVVQEERLDKAARVRVLRNFLADFPGDKNHREVAEHMIRVLERGEEPVSPERRRTKTEWFALRVNGGNYGGGFNLSLFTLRWRWFFWELVKGGVGGGAPCNRCDNNNDRPRWWGYGGMMWGVPFYLDFLAKHELRLGLGVGAGIVNESSWDDPGSEYGHGYMQSFGPFLIPEVTYVWHSREHFALQAGLNVIFSVVSENVVPPPVLNIFFGFKI